MTIFSLSVMIFIFIKFSLNIQNATFCQWEGEKKKKLKTKKKQDRSCDGLVREAGGYSNAYRCDLLFGMPTTPHSSLYSCTTSVHAESPPPKTLISYGARDLVQTSTSPDEISF